MSHRTRALPSLLIAVGLLLTVQAASSWADPAPSLNLSTGPLVECATGRLSWTVESFIGEGAPGTWASNPKIEVRKFELTESPDDPNAGVVTQVAPIVSDQTGVGVFSGSFQLGTPRRVLVQAKALEPWAGGHPAGTTARTQATLFIFDGGRVTPVDSCPSSPPDSTVPDSTVPNSTVPDSTMPESTVPESTAPNSTAPDSTVPDTTVPDTTVPDTTVPEWTVPDTEPDTEPDTTEPYYSPPRTLPFTGAQAAPVALLGALFVGAGVVLLRQARRRPR